MRSTKPNDTLLGDLQPKVDERIRSGSFATPRDVIRAGLHALDREEVELEDVLRERVSEAIADTRPSIPAEEVFADLRARHAGRVKTAKKRGF